MPPPPPAPIADAAAPAATPLAIRADRRIELMAILMRLAGADEYRAAATPYARAVDQAFAAFARHPAVARTRELRARHGIGHDAPMTFAVHLDDDLALVNADELAVIDARWRGVDVAGYAELVRRFAADAGLDAFVAAHRADYAAAEDALRAIATPSPVAFFEELFGAHGTHAVVPGMLLGTNNVGVRNGDAFYQVLSQPDRGLLVHEMAHSYINPAFARHAAALAPAGQALYPLVADAMRAQRYVDWPTLLNESGVRALTVLFLRETQGDAAGAAAARAELRASFVWIEDVVEVFRRYRRDRASYADFDAYMPAVVACFDGLVRRYAGAPPRTPFLGPFDAVLRGDYVLALAPGPAADYARTLPFFANRPVVAPGAAVAPGRGIVAYGTPATNPTVARVAAAAGWKLAADGIALGARRFAGAHLVLIATWPRHDDPNRGVAVYAAADELDLVGINNLRHGPRDWLVARRIGDRFQLVETGDWPVENGAWIPFR